MRTHPAVESGLPSLAENDGVPILNKGSVGNKDSALLRAHLEDLLDGMDLTDEAVPLDDPTPEDLELIEGALDEEREEGE